jgi:uncharacterized protein
MDPSFETPAPLDPVARMSTYPPLPPVAAPLSSPHVLDGPSPDERTMAMLAELLQLFSWMIGPLIIFFVKRDSPFVRFHALQAILWQVAMTMFSIVFFVAMVAMMFAMPKSGGSNSTLPMVFVLSFYALFGLFSLANFIIAIYFAVKANSGAWASYPIIGRIARSILSLPASA